MFGLLMYSSRHFETAFENLRSSHLVQDLSACATDAAHTGPVPRDSRRLGTKPCQSKRCWRVGTGRCTDRVFLPSAWSTRYAYFCLMSSTDLRYSSGFGLLRSRRAHSANAVPTVPQQPLKVHASECLRYLRVIGVLCVLSLRPCRSSRYQPRDLAVSRRQPKQRCSAVQCSAVRCSGVHCEHADKAAARCSRTMSQLSGARIRYTSP